MYWLVTRDFLIDQGFGDNVEKHAPRLSAIATGVSELPALAEYYTENSKNGFAAMGFAF